MAVEALVEMMESGLRMVLVVVAAQTGIPIQMTVVCTGMMVVVVAAVQINLILRLPALVRMVVVALRIGGDKR